MSSSSIKPRWTLIRYRGGELSSTNREGLATEIVGTVEVMPVSEHEATAAELERFRGPLMNEAYTNLARAEAELERLRQAAQLVVDRWKAGETETPESVPMLALEAALEAHDA